MTFGRLDTRFRLAAMDNNNHVKRIDKPHCSNTVPERGINQSCQQVGVFIEFDHLNSKKRCSDDVCGV